MNNESMWRHGIILTEAGQPVAKPGLTPDELREAGVPLLKTECIHDGTGRERIDVGPVRVAGYEVMMDLYFNQNRLEIVGIDLSHDATLAVCGRENPASQLFPFYETWVMKQTGHAPPVKRALGDNFGDERSTDVATLDLLQIFMMYANLTPAMFCQCGTAEDPLRACLILFDPAVLLPVL